MPNGHYTSEERLVAVEQNQKTLIKKVDAIATKFDAHVETSVTLNDLEQIQSDYVVLRGDVDTLQQYAWKAVGAISLLLLLVDKVLPLYV